MKKNYRLLAALALTFTFFSCEHLDDFIGDGGGSDDAPPMGMVNIAFLPGDYTLTASTHFCIREYT